MKKTIQQIAIILISLAAIEGISKAVLWGYQQKLSLWNSDVRSEMVTKKLVPASHTTMGVRLSNPEIGKDHKVVYGYSSYLAYRLEPSQSKYVNVSPQGYRVNGSEPEVTRSSEKGLTVWMFGSSALFGGTNLSDHETVPAYLESILREKTKRPVNVINFGVPGYKSFQEIQYFKQRLLSGSPDIVVFFSGFNDYVPQDDSQLFNSLMVHDQFSFLWKFHDQNGIVNWQGVRDFLRSLMPNTTALSQKAKKLVWLLTARNDMAGWREAYRHRRHEEFDRQLKFIPLAIDFFINNLLSGALLAKTKGIQTILVHQPTPLILDTTTVLPYEKLIIEHRKRAWEALSDGQLDALKSVPSYRLSQDRLLDWSLWESGYRNQIAAVRVLAEELMAGFVDAQAVMANNVDQPLFVDLVHFTWNASELIAREISGEIIRLNPAIFSAEEQDQ